MNKGRVPNFEGSIIVEFVLSLHILVLVLISCLFFTRGILLREKILHLAHLGTELQASQQVSGEIIQKFLENELARQGITEREGSVEIGRFLETPASRFYNLVMTRISCRWGTPFLEKLGFETLNVNETVVMETSYEN